MYLFLFLAILACVVTLYKYIGLYPVNLHVQVFYPTLNATAAPLRAADSINEVIKRAANPNKVKQFRYAKYFHREENIQ
ncbi:MAG: hypothetical protein NVS2B12_00700 [Ktedonobacteraceae bacterium]